MPLGTEVGLVPGDVVLDGDPAPPKKEHSSAPTSAHVYCSQTAGWMKMSFGTQVGLGPGHVVLDGNAALPQRSTAPPIFGPFLVKRLGCHLVWRQGSAQAMLCYTGTQLPPPKGA